MSRPSSNVSVPMVTQVQAGTQWFYPFTYGSHAIVISLQGVPVLWSTDAVAPSGRDMTRCVPSGGSAPAPAPPPAAQRFITGAELLTVLKGYSFREVDTRSRPGGLLYLSPDGSYAGSPSGDASGSFYAWSQLMWGGQGTVSNLSTTLNGRPPMNIEFMTSSGPSGYIAHMKLGGERGSGQIEFDEIHTINEWDRIPIDGEVFEWRKDWGTGSALVRLIVQSVEGSATAFRVCWLTQYGVLNRLACTVHGHDYAAYVVDDYFGNVQQHISTIGRIVWRTSPPAGTPASAPNPGPLRYLHGSSVTSLLAGPLSGAGATSVVVRDAAGRSGQLSARVDWTTPSFSTTFSSSVGGGRSATVSYVTTSPRFTTGPLPGLTLEAEGERIVFAQNSAISSTEIYPLDAMLLDERSGSARASLILQSFPGEPRGYRLCWLTQYKSLKRLFCGVAGVPGTTGFMIDDSFGDIRTFR